MNLPDLKKLRIVYYPDPVLKRLCPPANAFGPELGALAGRMLELMREAEGVGLAAPQVGIPIRLFVCNSTREPSDDLIAVNPRFIELEEASEQEEGCLSIPGVTVTMRRATRVVMEAFDTRGKPFHTTADDTMARILQHEVDHLNGRLIVDHMSAADEIANRGALKHLRERLTARGRC